MSDTAPEPGPRPERPAAAATATAGVPAGPVPGLELLGELGRGATTVVHRARRTGAAAPDVAVKMLREHAADATDVAATYRREAALLARVAHPAVTAVHAAGEAAGRPYLVLELVEGTALAQAIEEGPLPEHRVLRIAIDAAGALAAVHRMRLVHRDVKPDNLMITPSGRVKLIDFDLATWAGEPAPDETVAGTLAYSAPEQTGMFARPVDARADLYALGVVLFECITGRTPFSAPDVGQLLHLHAVEPPPDIRGLRPECPPGLAAIVAKLLAKDPDDRYQSAAALEADLRRLLDAPATWPFPLDSASMTVTAPHSEPPLVGRQLELAELVQRWQRAVDGAGGLALLDGPVGVGKARLVSELVRAVTDRGGRALGARCAPGDPAPLGVLRAAMQRHVESVQRLAGPEREAAEQRLRRAAEDAEPLLGELSPALAALLGADGQASADHDRQEQVAAAIAGFFSELALAEGGLLVILEDVHRIDSASERVLQYLCAEAGTAPLLIVLTTQDDAAVGLPTRLIMPPDTRVRLGPLSPEAVTELVTNELGGAQIPAEIAEQLGARTGGNPFALLEYIRQLIDAGGLRPSWGTWILDTALLDRLHLPSDVLDLMLTRLEGLDSEVRSVLAAAAVQGMRFSTTVLARVADRTTPQVNDVIAVATRHRVIEHVGHSVHTFVHGKVRAALLGDLDVPAQARMHAQTADALETERTADPDEIYQIIHEIARHRVAAGAESPPRMTYAACMAAGRLALNHHAPAEAVRFLAGAAQAASAAGISLDVRFREAYATTLLRTGELAGAREQLNLALETEQDGLRRAALFELVAKAEIMEGAGDAALAAVRNGLTALGTPLPRRLPWLVITSLLRLVAGTVVGLTRPGRATGRRRQRDAREASLLDTGAHATAHAMRDTYLPLLVLRALLPASRLGRSPQRARVLMALGLIAGPGRLGRRISAAAERDAALLGDPTLVAVTGAMGGLARASTDPQGLIEAFETHARLLDLLDYLTLVAAGAYQLRASGWTAVAERWIEQARTRLRLTGAARTAFAVECLASAVEVMCGRAAQASATLERAVEELGGPLSDRHRMHAACTALTILTEQGEFGAAFDTAVAELSTIRLTPVGDLASWTRYAIAGGRLMQAQRCEGAERTDRLTLAERELRALGRRRDPTFRAGHLALRAWELHLRGRDERALRVVHRALAAADGIQAPTVTFDILRVHARVLQALGRRHDARRQASFALLMAVDAGWEYRAQSIRAEFGIDDRGSGSRRSSTGPSSYETTTGESDVHQRRRFDALRQVSATAASVLDPDELIRVVLDITLRLLSAERAFVFLAEQTTTADVLLQPHRGRDADGNDLHELTGYSSTLVDRVRVSREALVVTGSEQGAALGSRSAVVHGLRSILVAPLQLKGRLLGVAYLDSRVARGIFTDDDVELLEAITHQIAASLETARTAQLDAEIQAANRQRALAETLSTSMTELSSTLDPQEVLRRALRHQPGRLEPVALDGAGHDDPGVEALDTASHPVLTQLDTCDTPISGDDGVLALPAPLAQLLGTPRSWLAVPITPRQERTAVIVVGAPDPGSYTDVEVKIAAVLGDQGAVAYDNARLFSREREAATVDALTHLATRRHFWELAQKALASAARHSRPLAAIMLDIDHFKAVNDTYGHAVGDAVLQEVAARVQASVREADIVGRYGGEEFAMVLPESPNVTVLAERLRSAVAATPVTAQDHEVGVTVSVGISYLQPDDDLDSLLGRADVALYTSKAQGRDRVTAG